jgi:two-component system, OmpR family, sensor histidine kinase MtrB
VSIEVADASGAGPTDSLGVSESRRARSWRRLFEVAERVRPQRFGLRTRILLMFLGGALGLSVFLGLLAYGFTRSSVGEQRDRSSVSQSYRNADVAGSVLSSEAATPAEALSRLRGIGVTRVALYVDGQWSGSARFGPSAVPSELQSIVINDRRGARMIVRIDGVPTLVVGTPLELAEASYFEFIELTDDERTLRNVALSLTFGAAITTMIGGLIGWFAASRAVRPLGDAARAAKAIAGGRLDTRLAPTDDQDLQVLADSFNDMAAALEARVERDARFASDVSHELRSPLMTLAASAEVMSARRDDMPERAQSALDLLVADVSRFQGLVEDLLEISRFDAGAIRLHLEDLLVAEFVRAAVAISSLPSTPVDVSTRAEGLVIRGDRRRLARVVANLIDNARVHGGGEPGVEVHEADGEGEPIGHVWITVSDHGAGVPEEERALVFERFARGAVAGRRSSSDGAGLGLALVDEHVRMHSGRAWVEDRVDGQPGARFIVELPADEVG